MFALSVSHRCARQRSSKSRGQLVDGQEALLSHTGMTAADVELVYEPSKEKLLALAAQQHHQNANTPTLTSHNLLVITLHWLRRKPTYEELARLYPHSGHYWHSMVRRSSPLSTSASSTASSLLSPRRPTSVYFPNVKIIVDTTFVPLPRLRSSPPTTIRRVRRRQRGSTRSPATSLTALSAARRAFMVAQHDMRIIRESGLLNQSSPTALIMGDKGYRGKLGIVVPASKKAKVSKEVQQLEDEKQRGHELQLSERRSRTSISV